MTVTQRSRTLYGLALSEQVLVDAIKRRRFSELATFISRTGADFVLLGVERVSRTAPRPTAALSPSVSAAALVTATEDIGIFVTAVPHLDHPYNLARRLASLDHTSRGRIGWLASIEDRSAPNERAPHSLWEGCSADPKLGRRSDIHFADPDRIVYANQRGVFDIVDPLATPTPAQQRIPVAWWAQDGDDIASAAEVSDIVVLDSHQLEHYGDQVRGRALLFVTDDSEATGVDGHIATVTDIDTGFSAWPRPSRTRNRKKRSLRATLRLPDPLPAPTHTRLVHPGSAG